MSKIGFIGVGNMGSRMCARLLEAKQVCKVYDVHPVAANAMAQQGAEQAAKLADLADCSIIITMLQSGEQVEQTIEPLFDCVQAGTTFIDCSSIDIETTRKLHQHAKDNGFHFIDAPVSGGIKGAESGTLTIMVGGEASTLKSVQPILEYMGQNIIHTGHAGCGQAAKMCNNMILGVSMIAVSEAFNLAKAAGLEAEKLYDICSNASGQCWSLTSYCPEPDILDNVPSNNDYKPGFAARMMFKDLNLSQDAADTMHVKTPMGYLAYELYQKMLENGKGDLDFSAIIKDLAN